MRKERERCLVFLCDFLQKKKLINKKEKPQDVPRIAIWHTGCTQNETINSYNLATERSSFGEDLNLSISLWTSIT